MIKKHTPNQEQQNIIDVEGNVVVTANPGSGKTFTIVEKVSVIIEQLLDYQGIIAISFTRKASKELELRCKKRGIDIRGSFFGTIDKFYLTEIIYPYAKFITGSKIELEVRSSIEEYPEYRELLGLSSSTGNEYLNQLLLKSLSEGHIFLEICGEIALYIMNNVKECRSYLRARYTHIFIDEYQDCGEVQHKIFKTLVDNGMVGAAVGDLNQAIYGFSNRYSKYLLSLIEDQNFTHLQISKNHRCHQTISEYSLALLGVRNISLSQEPRVKKINIEGTDKDIAKAIDRELPRLKREYGLVKNSDFAILCRGNASAKRVSSFLNTDNKLFEDTPLDRSNSRWGILFNDILSSFFSYKASQSTIIYFVEQYINEETDKKKFTKALEMITSLFSLEDYELKNNYSLLEEIAELIYPGYYEETICTTVQNILTDDLRISNFKPATDNQVNIMTIHKSKGLEFNFVFLLDTYKYILPPEHRNATLEDFEQALNLHYVGVTRAIEACYIVISTWRYRAYRDDFVNAEESPFLYTNNVANLRENIFWNIESDKM